MNDLNTQFPQAGFDGRVRIAPGTQKMRASTGIELQVMLPVVNAPFRLYWAYNPSDRSRVPAAADRGGPVRASRTTTRSSIRWRSSDRRTRTSKNGTMFRFTIGRTF